MAEGPERLHIRGQPGELRTGRSCGPTLLLIVRTMTRRSTTASRSGRGTQPRRATRVQRSEFMDGGGDHRRRPVYRSGRGADRITGVLGSDSMGGGCLRHRPVSRLDRGTPPMRATCVQRDDAMVDGLLRTVTTNSIFHQYRCCYVL